MRHQKDGFKLGRRTNHRWALFRNLLVALFRHERIVTTEAKAKAVRGLADQMITLAKRENLHARRQVLAPGARSFHLSLLLTHAFRSRHPTEFGHCQCHHGHRWNVACKRVRQVLAEGRVSGIDYSTGDADDFHRPCKDD